MIPSNPICQVCDYGSSAVYRELPSEEQIRSGVIPLDSLPAAWWNCMWNMTNGAVNQARTAVGVLIDEVNTVLQQAGVCVCDTCVDQLYTAINNISQIIGNASRAGAVKSSSTCGQVSISSAGIMTANGLGNASQLTTTAQNAIGAINELKSTYDGCWSANVTALAGKAPTSHASSGTSYGVGSASNYGHLKISDQYTSVLSACSGVAASQKAVACVYQYASDVAAAAAALGLGNTAGCALGTAAAGSATTAARSDHVHPLPAITSLSGTLAIAHGGTGATCAAGARTNLGLKSAAVCEASAFLGASACAVDSNKLGGCTYACAKADILSGNAATATNATCFGGCTYAQAKADILSGNAATATNATCFGGCTYAQAKANILTGCAADSAKFAGCTYAQAKANILTGCAADSAKFAGCTYACAKADILTGNAATATNATCFGGCTYAQAKADIRNYTPANATNAVDSTCFAGCTYAQAKADIRDGLAPTSHASTATTYGIGSTTNYGHLKICDTYTASCGDAAAGVAASQKAVYNAYNSGRNFGNTASYAKFVCAAAAEAAAADCAIVLGYARSYRWCACTTNVCSYDRRTYSKIGTYQCQNKCAGFVYMDVCNWQCCYSGTEGVTTCTNRRFCFQSDGYFVPPVGLWTTRICGRNATFGCQLIADRYAASGSAAVTFARCGTILGHIGTDTVGGALKRFTANGAASYTILDTSAAVTIAQGGTGAATAADARTNLGLGSAAVCAASAFLGASACAADSAKLGNVAAACYLLKTGCAADSAKLTGKAPSALCVACAGANGSGTAFGAAATCAVKTLTAKGNSGYNSSCAACQQLLVTTGFMSFWDGSYNGSNSNLTYYCGGTFGSAAAKTAGAAVGNVPLIGTALGNTDKNIVVTDTAGKLKPSGTVIGSAAGKTAGSAAGNVPLINSTAGLGTTDGNILVTDASGNLKASGTTLGSAAGCAATAFLAAAGCAADSTLLTGKAPSALCVARAGYALRACDVYFASRSASSCTVCVCPGSGVACIRVPYNSLPGADPTYYCVSVCQSGEVAAGHITKYLSVKDTTGNETDNFEYRIIGQCANFSTDYGQMGFGNSYNNGTPQWGCTCLSSGGSCWFKTCCTATRWIGGNERITKDNLAYMLFSTGMSATCACCFCNCLTTACTSNIAFKHILGLFYRNAAISAYCPVVEVRLKNVCA